jgi:hypothetical protein
LRQECRVGRGGRLQHRVRGWANQKHINYETEHIWHSGVLSIDAHGPTCSPTT